MFCQTSQLDMLTFQVYPIGLNQKLFLHLMLSHVSVKVLISISIQSPQFQHPVQSAATIAPYTAVGVWCVHQERTVFKHPASHVLLTHTVSVALCSVSSALRTQRSLTHPQGLINVLVSND